jgi:hypothetical protein
MADGRDASGSMNVEADVTFLRHDRLACVKPHAHPDRSLGQRLLPGSSRGQRIAGAGEGDEERVALRVDLDPAVPAERIPEDTPVIGKCLGISVAELVQQPGRALDVGEKEGDRPAGQLPHARMIR